MNVLTDTASGTVAMTAAEAERCIAYLRGRLAHAEQDEQRHLTAAIARLRLVTHPEDAFAADYAPAWYAPAWT